MAGMEQDPIGKSPYSYEKGIDYVSQVVEDTIDLPPGVGILIDPSRLIGSAIEKKNPYYLPIGGLRIYGKNQEDVIKVASKVDPTKFKPDTTARFSLKGREVSTALNQDPQPVKKNSFFTRATQSARSLGKSAVEGASALGKRATQSARSLGQSVAQGASALGKRAAQGASTLGKGAAGVATSTRKIATDAVAAARKATGLKTKKEKNENAAKKAESNKRGARTLKKITEIEDSMQRMEAEGNAEKAAKATRQTNEWGLPLRTGRGQLAATAYGNQKRKFEAGLTNIDPNNLFANADAPARAPAAAKKPSRANFEKSLKPVNINSLFANDESPGPVVPPPRRTAPPLPAPAGAPGPVVPPPRRTAPPLPAPARRGTPPRARANQQGQLSTVVAAAQAARKPLAAPAPALTAVQQGLRNRSAALRASRNARKAASTSLAKAANNAAAQSAAEAALRAVPTED